MGRIRDRVVVDDWRERGFDFTAADAAEVDAFFDAWSVIYNLPNITAYRSREGLTAIYEAGIAMFGEGLNDRERRNVASVLRAGYVVAVTEASERLRREPDANLARLFELMYADDPSGQNSELAIATWRGRHLSEVATRLHKDVVEARAIPGFRLREAVFADIKRLLFRKLQIQSWPRARLDADTAEEAVRLGHVIGFCEEALSQTLPVTSGG